MADKKLLPLHLVDENGACVELADYEATDDPSAITVGDETVYQSNAFAIGSWHSSSLCAE